MNKPYSRVSIEVGEEIDDGFMSVVRHESGSIGEIEVGLNLGEVLGAIGGRVFYHLAKAAVKIDEDFDNCDNVFPESMREFLDAASKYIADWASLDEKQFGQMANQVAPPVS